jgi:branched-chain amino acid aminotransferase
MKLAKDKGIEVRESALPREMLYIADELFMTGTAAEITPIRSVDRLQVGNGKRGPITESLQAAFFGLFSGKTPDKYNWLDAVDMTQRVAAVS